MAMRHHIANPLDLKPDDSLIVAGLDWSWCFVWFKEIPDFPGYWAGSNGTIWSAWKRGAYGKCSIVSGFWRQIQPYSLKPSGHQMVVLYRGGKGHRRLVHRLILETFFGPCPEGMEACHFPDRDPGNNRLDNLRWDTPYANAMDAHKHHTKPSGENSPNAKLTWDQVGEMRELYRRGETIKAVADLYGINGKTASRALFGEGWRDEFLPDGSAPVPSPCKRIGHAWQKNYTGNSGSKNRCSKLTEQIVLSIRDDHVHGRATAKELAVKYGVTPTLIYNIINRKSWKHI